MSHRYQNAKLLFHVPCLAAKQSEAPQELLGYKYIFYFSDRFRD